MASYTWKIITTNQREFRVTGPVAWEEIHRIFDKITQLHEVDLSYGDAVMVRTDGDDIVFYYDLKPSVNGVPQPWQVELA